MASASVDLRDIEALREYLTRLPETLTAEAERIVEGAADGLIRDAGVAYRQTFDEESGDLFRGLGKRRLGKLSWQAFNSWGTAHWFEFGTINRTTRDTGANRGAVVVATGTGAIGGFTGRKATPTVRSTAVFRPIWVPLAIRHRAAMVEQLKALVTRAGFRVTGDA